MAVVAIKRGLAPVAGNDSRFLILGSMPGDESLRLRQYYSHSRNEFWVILARVFDEQTGASYSERWSFLRRHGIALWDVLREAELRPGSRDSDIHEPAPNNFATFFATHPRIKYVGLNGTKAHALWRRFVANRPRIPPSLHVTVLPSTSSTRGRNVCSLDEKVVRWAAFLSE